MTSEADPLTRSTVTGIVARLSRPHRLALLESIYNDARFYLGDRSANALESLSLSLSLLLRLTSDPFRRNAPLRDRLVTLLDRSSRLFSEKMATIKSRHAT